MFCEQMDSLSQSKSSYKLQHYMNFINYLLFAHQKKALALRKKSYIQVRELVAFSTDDN